MIDTFKNTELAHRHAAEALSLIGRRSTGIRINPNATSDSKAGVLGNEILPTFTLTKQGPKEIVAHPAVAPGRPDTRLLDSLCSSAGNIRVHRSRTPQLSAERPGERRDNAGIGGASRFALQKHPARRAWINTWRLQNLREKDGLRDPGSSIGAAAEGSLPLQQGCKTLCFAVGQQERIVDGMAATVGCPIPTMGISVDRTRSTFDLDKDQARRSQDQQVDLVYSPLVVYEFEI
jgi:hypothetical protein